MEKPVLIVILTSLFDIYTIIYFSIICVCCFIGYRAISDDEKIKLDV